MNHLNAPYVTGSAGNMFNSVYPAGAPPSRYDITLKDRKCGLVPLIFSVDSRYRNYAVPGRMGNRSVTSETAYPVDRYTVPLPSVYRDMVSIELIKAAIPAPDTECPGDRRYLILSIGYSHCIGNNPAVAGSLCNIYPEGDGYVYTRGSNDPDAGYTYYFPEPGIIAKFDIKLTYADGTIPTFTSAGCDHVLTFELRGLNQPKVLLC
jgi:hypothetical protein